MAQKEVISDLPMRRSRLRMHDLGESNLVHPPSMDAHSVLEVEAVRYLRRECVISDLSESCTRKKKHDFCEPPLISSCPPVEHGRFGVDRSLACNTLIREPHGIEIPREEVAISESAENLRQEMHDIGEDVLVSDLSGSEEFEFDSNDDFSSDTGFIDDVEVDGRRIVDINFFLRELHAKLNNHSRVCKHAPGNCRIVRYINRGLRTQIFFKCQKCDHDFHIWTTPDDESIMGINKSAVCGTFTAGAGCYALQEVLAAMDIPAMSAQTYGKYRDELFDTFKGAAKDSMIEAGKEEYAIANKKGNVIGDNGCATVVADGSWPKRSYPGGKYDSLSGVGLIVGHETKKVLDMSVRNKYCMICAEAQRLNKEPRKHVCYKNWGRDQSSTSMEADIICEGFKRSVETHKLMYKTIISDGDSSTFQAIQDAKPYTQYDVVVDKVECSNHLFRNLCRKMREASKLRIQRINPTEGDVSVGNLRKYVQSSGLAIRKYVELARDLRKKEDVPADQKRQRLQKDILIIFEHAFGDHSKCGTLPFPCMPKATEKNMIRQLQASGIYPSAYDAVKYLGYHAGSLLEGVTNNIAESGNSIINKLNAGKRINYCARNSYEMRCYGAIVQYNSQDLLSKLFVRMGHKVPTAVSNLERSRQLHVGNNRLRRLEQGRYRHRGRHHCIDENYGPRAQKPDQPKDVYDALVEDHFNKLLKYQENRDQIERDTVSQGDSAFWRYLRTIIITASNFGKIVLMRKTTSCVNTVTSICYPKVLETAAVQFGLANEQVAKEALELKLGKKITPCGLFIHSEIPYLGASPDGLIDNDGIVEIKCPFSAKDVSVDYAIEHNINVRRIFDRKNKDLMSKSHPYYFQVLGQLIVTNRSYCIFALWTTVDLKYIKVLRDDEFWITKMEPSLSRFYKECMLPEIVDSRHNRSMPIRDPEYILKAQEQVQSKRALALERKEKRDENVHKRQRKTNPVVSELSRVTCETNDINQNACSEEPQSRSNDISSILSGIRPQNAPWARIEMNEEIDISEQDREVLEVARRDISVEEVIADVLPQISLLNDSSIDLFQLIVEENSIFRFYPASYTGYYLYIEPCRSGQDMQIIGGNGSQHWCCVHYDG